MLSSNSLPIFEMEVKGGMMVYFICIVLSLRLYHELNVTPLKVGSLEEAKKAINVGVDAIIVQGREAGGHVIGQV